MPIIAIEDLTFTYPGSKEAVVDHVSTSIEAGEFVLICGPTGCGKTTLLRQLKPVLSPHGERSGFIEFDGMPIGKLTERDQASRIGFVMQDPDSQTVTDKVLSEIAFGLENLGVDHRKMASRIADISGYFGIQEWLERHLEHSQAA